MYAMKLSLCMSHSFAFSSYFGVTQSNQNSYITTLFNSNINKTNVFSEEYFVT